MKLEAIDARRGSTSRKRGGILLPKVVNIKTEQREGNFENYLQSSKHLLTITVDSKSPIRQNVTTNPNLSIASLLEY